MDSAHRIEVPLRAGGGGKKMKKRRELDALIARSLTRRSARRNIHGGTHLQDKLLSVSTDDPEEDYAWTNVSGSTRRIHRKNVFFQMCGPLLFGITSALFVAILYWLYFDLRQELYDYRQKIEEVSALSKNFPDTLQKWHETSSFLIKNQSMAQTRINELQRSVEDLRTNFSNLEVMINAQRNYGKEEKLVADFGAKLEAVVTDLDGIKEHYNQFKETQKNIEHEVEELKNKLNTTMQQPKTIPANFTEDIMQVNHTLTNAIQLLANEFKDVNNTLSQETKIQREELQKHKIKLDDLLDRSENITSHVTTLSNSWPEYKQKLNTFDESLAKMEKEISAAKDMNSNLASKMESMCKNCEVAKSTPESKIEVLTAEPKVIPENVSTNRPVPENVTAIDDKN